MLFAVAAFGADGIRDPFFGLTHVSPIHPVPLFLAWLSVDGLVVILQLFWWYWTGNDLWWEQYSKQSFVNPHDVSFRIDDPYVCVSSSYLLWLVAPRGSKCNPCNLSLDAFLEDEKAESGILD